MPKKYHIPIKPTSPRFNPVGKYATIEFRENCAGSCKECVKKKCVYEVFKDNYSYVSSMKEPEYVYTCQSCFRCVQECTKGIFSRVINPEYRTLGDDYFKPDIIHRTWYQAHTGKIPVSGAGYRGPFVGKGFDSMWTDMSEIVRPTRDGIHGREYINTCIELSRRVSRLRFKDDMSLDMELPPILEIPLPLMFKQPSFGVLSDNVLVAAAMTAHRLETMMFIKPEDYTDVLMPYAESMVPCVTGETVDKHSELIKKSRMVELAYVPGIENEFDRVRGLNPDVIIAVGMPLNAQAADRAVTLTLADVDTLHFYADDHGNEIDSDNPRFLKEMIREIHLKLVEKCIRKKVKLVFSGGIAMAEHMAKAIICGADGITVDIPLLIALECRVCYQCVKGLPCPVRLEDFDPAWGSQRIANLIAAWRNQLIEVMGAMGIREVRRLCGEVGRSMWFEDLERESFAPLFGERKVKGLE
jgi:ferredoxin